MNAIVALVSGLGDLFGNLPTPGFLETIDDALGDAAAYAAGMGAWIPWGQAWNALGFIGGCVAVGFVIKLVRIVASFFTAGGGSAA